VSMEEGTGLVHIAPGHGLEDYQIGKKNKLPIFSPVAQNAEYSEEAGEYKGVAVPLDANALIQKELESLGVLLWKGNITH
ncbi:MAG: class I tRNA ligase family protein, partial [Candidatus Micrarchaeota archaeon]|nr:class I tRNA ligase family protein [Candidatus Micrarchaeota archaeon]